MTVKDIRRAVLVSLALATALFFASKITNANASASSGGGGRNGSINLMTGY